MLNLSLEWKTVELKSIATVTMGQSPKSEFYNENNEGMPFLQGNKTFGDKYPSFELYTTSIKKVAKKNNVLMSVRAPVGDLNIAQEDICIGRGCCALQMKDGVDEFLYYLLKANISQLINKESGTVFGSINKNDIETFEITLPKDLENQTRILYVLKNIDKKIEINKRINKNLEKEILEDPEEMQWLIYNGIEAYKKMVETDKDFIARANEKTTLELLGKHSDPISHILEKLVVFDSNYCYNEEDKKEDKKEIEDLIVAKELKELISYVAEKEGIAIDHIDKNGMIESRYLVNKIRKFLDNDEWSSKYLYVAYLGKSETIYPCLRKTDKYYKYLELMMDEELESD